VFSFFKFSCDVFLSHRIAVFLTSIVYNESERLLDTRRDRVAGTGKSEFSGNASAGPLATLDDACQDWDKKH
jgi:hypothetical protein